MNKTYWSTTMVQCALLTLLGVLPAFPSDAPDATPYTKAAYSATDAPLWANQGRWNFGAQVGYAFEYGLAYHEVSRVNFLIAQPQLGLILADAPSSRLPVRRLELVTEGILGGVVRPSTAYMTGVALLFRFDGRNFGRWAPFIDAGAGVLRTSLSQHVPELNGTTQFSPQAGLGLQYFLRPQRAVVFEFRTVHMSNAGVTPPNMGFNSGMITIGFRWLRRPR